MGKINVLDFQVANLIAAGEVVDRPASVIKELIENAIDAGAGSVTVEIQRGGIRYMRVTDDGCGMARDDVPVALKRHATSKIKDADDLNAILTLGFRGEALAAISSVSKVRIMTKQAGDANGTLLSAEGGRVAEISDCGCPRGTSVIVEELFYNVPARQKFLKKDATETAAVIGVAEKVALSHPEIALKLITDGETKFATMGDGVLRNAIYAVLGRDFVRKMMPVRGGFDGVELDGFVGTPENVRANRNFQIFFINSRFIRSKTMSSALEQAFVSFIPTEKFPCGVLFLRLHPSLVDVNVHPAKLEVKFSNEKLVFESVYYTVRNALENTVKRPEFDRNPEALRSQIQRDVINANVPLPEGRHSGEARIPARDLKISLAESAANAENAQAPSPDAEMREVPAHEPYEPPRTIPKLPWEEPMKQTKPKNTEEPSGSNACPRPAPGGDFPKTTGAFAPFSASMPVMTEPEKPPASYVEKDMDDEVKPIDGCPDFRLAGELFNTYVMVEVGDTCLIVDKHAAHERILFEELKKNLHNRETYGQMMLTPLPLGLDSAEADAANQHRDELEKTGYLFEIHEKQTFLHQIPAQLDSSGAESAFVEICGFLADNTGSVAADTETRFERALYQGACKAAIKAGRIYDEGHIRWIIERLLLLPDIKYCPHGRPVCFEMTKQAIAHRFLRT